MTRSRVGGYELRDQTSAIIRCAELRTDLLRGIRRSPPTAGVHTDFYLDGGRHQTELRASSLTRKCLASLPRTMDASSALTSSVNPIPCEVLGQSRLIQKLKLAVSAEG